MDATLVPVSLLAVRPALVRLQLRLAAGWLGLLLHSASSSWPGRVEGGAEIQTRAGGNSTTTSFLASISLPAVSNVQDTHTEGRRTPTTKLYTNRE